ncbi:MAG: hypothetical protein U9M95_05015 [Candidatus Altiarchaeota archaeon]|nr:hypothetical protein [Candidatus Altiarchaeota archaeon]
MMPSITGQQVMSIQLMISIILILFLAVSLFYRWIITKKGLLDTLKKDRNRIVTVFLIIIAITAGINYFYFSRAGGLYIHRWDMYHVIINSKYYEELGYMKLYECSIVFDAESNNYFKDVDTVRDLNTLRYIKRDDVLKDSDCNKLFTKERKEEFIKDLNFFYSLAPYSGYWKRLFTDKGYNGPPFYTFLVSMIVGKIDLSYINLLILAMLDISLILLAFYMIYKAFGLRVCLIAFIFFCINFPNRFVHMGGTILKFDYVAYLIISICLLRLEKYKLSGFFMALASMIRIFPVLFAAGLALKAVMESVKVREIKKRYINFFIAFGASLIILFLLSLTVGNGLENWVGFYEDMNIHNKKTAGFRIGFKHMFMFHGEITKDDKFIPFSQKAREFEAVQIYYYTSIVSFLLLVVFLIYKLDDVNSSIIFGVLMFYLLFASTRYYYSILVLLFLFTFEFHRERWYMISAILLFTISAITYWVYSFNNFDAFIYNYFLSFLLLIYFIYLLASLIHKYG